MNPRRRRYHLVLSLFIIGLLLSGLAGLSRIYIALFFIGSFANF